MSMETYILPASALCLFIVSILILIYVRIQLVVYTRKLSDCLDSMISGKEDILFEEERETLVGKLQVKMRYLYEIMQERARENQKERQKLESTISDISHQVKTPIASIRMYLNLLEKETNGNKISIGNKTSLENKVSMEQDHRMEFFHALEKQVDKLEFLMQSMIKMSRLETGIVRVKPQMESIYSLIEQAVCDAALKAEAKNIDITVRCDKRLQAYFDRRWTLEAVFNILDNAVKYSNENGKIQISAMPTDFFVRIRIQDNGRGISEAHITEIFRRFYREPEAAQIEGVGIGLYLAREIVTKQKGFVEVQSKKDEGSAFSLHIPAKP